MFYLNPQYRNSLVSVGMKSVTAMWNREAISMYAGSSSFLISSVNVLFNIVIVPFTKRIPLIVDGSSEIEKRDQQNSNIMF